MEFDNHEIVTLLIENLLSEPTLCQERIHRGDCAREVTLGEELRHSGNCVTFLGDRRLPLGHRIRMAHEANQMHFFAMGLGAPEGLALHRRGLEWQPTRRHCGRGRKGWRLHVERRYGY
jgi:hypothetical protein